MSGVVDEIVSEVRRLPGVEETRSRWGAVPAFRIDGREFFHAGRDAVLDIRLTRRLIRELDDDRLVYRPGSSDWVWLRVESRDDIPFALELVRRALAANARV
jgi:Luciferase